MNSAFSLVYLTAGVLLSIPYCFLAGWSIEGLIATTFLAPGFLACWFVLARLARVVNYGQRWTAPLNVRAALGREHGRAFPGALPAFWLFTLLGVVPIVLRLVAILLMGTAYESIGLILHAHRYMGPFYVFIGALTLIVVGNATILAFKVLRVWLSQSRS